MKDPGKEVDVFDVIVGTFSHASNIAGYDLVQSIKTPSETSLHLTQCNVPGPCGTDESESAVLGTWGA